MFAFEVMGFLISLRFIRNDVVERIHSFGMAGRKGIPQFVSPHSE